MVPLSIVICTWNRLPYLKDAVRSILDQTYRDFELIVVDNASTDGTAEYLKEIAQTDCRIRVVREGRLGVSYARNLGIEESRGAILAFFDDDSLAEPDWAMSVLRAFRENPGCTGIGGRIDPIWENERPIWLDRAHLPFFTVFDLGDVPCEIRSPKFLVGTNLAFDRAMLGKNFRFSSQFGRVGSHLLSCEEDELQSRLEADGHKFFYDPRMRVNHRLKPSCLRLGWLFRRYFWHGYAMALLKRPVGFDPHPSKVPFRVVALAGFLWGLLQLGQKPVSVGG